MCTPVENSAYKSNVTLRKIPTFHLISWCGNFEKNAKLCIYKFQHQESRRNFGILRSVKVKSTPVINNAHWVNVNSMLTKTLR